MSTTEGLQQQSWPDLDVSYFRWEPPVFSTGLGPSEAQASGKPGRQESAFAHSPYPTTFAGWDRVRAAAVASDQRGPEPSSGRVSSRETLQLAEERHHPAATLQSFSEPYQSSSGSMPSFPGQPTHAFEAQQSRSSIGAQGSSSAFTSLRPGEKQQQQQQQQQQHPAAADGGPRSLYAWQQQAGPGSAGPPQAAFGAAFDGVFGGGGKPQPAGVRYGVPDGGFGSSRAASVGQSSLPVLLVQCGKFSAPVQRDGQRPTPQQQQQPQGWLPAHAQSREVHGSSWHAPKAPAPLLQRAPSSTDPLQLQEFYTAQSDIIGELIKGNRDPQFLAAAAQGGHEMEHDFLDVLGPSHLGRAASVLDVPRVHPAMSSRELEMYMPAWQSESVPAELPNHVVNRLLMGGSARPTAQRHNRALSGTKRDWTGLPSMQSIPDDREMPVFDDPRGGLHPPTTREGGSEPASPSVNQLEELARTADVEVAHRAFLVPPHKKRGKGGRQPAADPRLDPSIDARRAKRILANRLSAARSKMKQKNQMDGLSGMVFELEEHGKLLREDAAELMEVCEETEFENRRLTQQAKVLEEYGRRLALKNSDLTREHATLLGGTTQHGRTEATPEDGRGREQPAPRVVPHDISLDGLDSKASLDSILRGLHQQPSAEDSLLQFARDT